MPGKIRYVRYLGNKWFLFVWAVVFFPLAIFLFLLDAVLIEQEIDDDELVRFMGKMPRNRGN